MLRAVMVGKHPSVVWYGSDALEISGSRGAHAAAIEAGARAVTHLSVGPLTRIPAVVEWDSFDHLTALSLEVAEGTTELVDLICRNKAALRSLRLDDSVLSDLQLSTLLGHLGPMDFVSFSVFERFSPELEMSLRALSVRDLFVRLRGFADVAEVCERVADAVCVSTPRVTLSVCASAGTASRLRRRIRAAGRGHFTLVAEPPASEPAWRVCSPDVWLLDGCRRDVSAHDGRRRSGTVEVTETFELGRDLRGFVERLRRLRPRRLRVLSEHLSRASLLATLRALSPLEEITLRPSHVFALEALQATRPVRLALIPAFRAAPAGPHVTRRMALAIRSWLEGAHGRASFRPMSALVPTPDAAAIWTTLADTRRR